MSAALESFLADTLLWTAALIALVLLLRRPVARLLGPQAAYALWLLPLLRLILPPMVLPAWLAPTPEIPAQGAPQAVDYGIEGFVAAAELAGETPAASDASSLLFDLAFTDWTPVLLALWLAGAGVFLAFRFSAYFRMRAALLEDSRPVGEAGRVRLVETAATRSPIAFGVIDRVIALPTGFMAQHDRTGRDLALEHELSHHRANDLLANFAVQPLFALHWFNPLGWYGWRAMRHDQEAACDARVIAACGSEHRATYAQVIASYAAGPSVALAAPMACPVIGEKSIIHRLRSLRMSEISPRRRWASRALIGAGLLALPLTASISYATDSEAPERKVERIERKMVIVDVPEGATRDDPSLHTMEFTRDDGTTVILKTAEPVTQEEAEARVEAAIASMPEPPEPPHASWAPRAPRAPGAPEAPNAPNAPKVHREHRIVINGPHGAMTAEEREELRRELREELGAIDGEVREAMREQRRSRIEFRNSQGERTRISVNCDDKNGASSWSSEDGRTMMFCATQVRASALEGLRAARDEIARSKDMPEDVRDTVLKALDEKIRNWNDS